GAGGLADLIAEYGGERLRFLLLRTHYRSTCVFGDEPLAEAGTALETFYRFFERFKKNSRQRFYNLIVPTLRSESATEAGDDPLLAEMQKLRTSFLEKMDDDFNTGGAVADLFEMVRLLNKFADQHNLDRFADEDKFPAKEVHGDPQVRTWVAATKILKEMSNLLGLFRVAPAKRGGGDAIVPKLMELILDLRKEARAKKDFATSDAIRDKLSELGVIVEDRKRVLEWCIGGAALPRLP